jgi:hypothetical protein
MIYPGIQVESPKAAFQTWLLGLKLSSTWLKRACEIENPKKDKANKPKRGKKTPDKGFIKMKN